MSETPSNKLTCRTELNNIGISTFLFQDACEDKSLRPTVVSEETVYEELRTLGRMFNVDGEHLITQMEADFNSAQALVSSNMGSTPLKAVWLDCVGTCCAVGEGEEPEVFVGAGNGVPQMLMNEADLTNLFANKAGNWACVKERDVIAARPDVFIVVDAAWDTALSKLKWLYNQSAFCELEVLKAAQLVQIPFSATSLGPRNGPAALDLATAALHVGLGADLTSGSSGVGYFDPSYLKTHTAGLQCSIDMDSVKYNAAASGHPQIKSALWPLELVVTLFVLI
jgi:iron complex transport system substrate-binding protein